MIVNIRKYFPTIAVTYGPVISDPLIQQCDFRLSRSGNAVIKEAETWF